MSVQFFIRVAEKSFAVSCCLESTMRMCADYLIEDTAADLDISISPEDILRERELLSADDAGASDNAVESLVLCRRIAEWLPGQDRVLFHGSSLALDGNGVLFTAKSGTGKSTHTRFWRETFGDRVQMINDDKPFLHVGKDAVTVYGTPWRGKHRLGSNISAPLKAICFVCRGEENKIEPVSPRELYALLLQQTYAPRDPRMMAMTLGLVDRLSKGVALYRLTCNLDPQAAEIACSGIFCDMRNEETI